MGIRTPDARVRVFISSTLGELAPERAAAREAVERLRLTPVMFELGARPHPPRALYRAYLEQSDVFVGIYWERYGWVAPGEEVSGLEDEYRLAAGRMPQLLYIKEPAPGRDAALDELLDRIRDDDRVAYRRFSAPDELAGLISDDLAVLLSERFQDAEPDDREPRRSCAPPAPLDRTFGRDDDVEAIVGLVRSGHRLVTLTGPGGIGKSRLAIEVTRVLAADFPDCVVWVPLAAVDDPALVLPAIAERLAVRLGGVGDLLDEVVAEVDRRPTLLVLDNFERVTAAAPEIAELLDRCPTAVAVVTSRHVLRVHGEREYLVPPLVGDAATALFAARAVAARQNFTLTPASAEAVEEITRRLDGLPLAIELAAARMRLYSPPALLDEISQRMDILSRGAADAPERQRTLRGTMDWSYELLDESERRLFARLAVFNGGWTLRAAEAVCARPGEPDVFETLASLVEKSLVVPIDDGGSEPRLRMLETVRAYAAEKLEQLPDRADTESRHTGWMFELLLGPSRRTTSPHHRAWLERFDQERANLRAAVERALRDRDVVVATHLVRAALGYLSLRDAESEAVEWLDRALAIADGADGADGADRVVRAQLLLARGVMAGALGRYQEAEAMVERAKSANPALYDDPFDAAVGAMTEAVVSSALHDPSEALDRARRAADAMAAIGSDVGEAYMLQTAGTVALSADAARAEEYLSRALRLADEMANDGLRAQSLTLLGFAARRAGRVGEARDRFVEAAHAGLRSGQRSGMAYALDGLAATALDMGSFHTAAHALASSSSARSSIDRPAWASFSPMLTEIRDAARAALGPAAFEAIWAEGSRSDIGRALRAALDAVTAALAGT